MQMNFIIPAPAVTINVEHPPPENNFNFCCFQINIKSIYREFPSYHESYDNNNLTDVI